MEINKKTVAIVTGGASGLGAATAKILSSHGIQVAIFDTDIDRARSFSNEIGAIAFDCDVSSEKIAKDCINKVSNELGIPRILVNCAGIGTPRRIVGKQGVIPLEEFQKIINVNLVGSFNIMRLVAEKMMTLDPLEDGQRGVIISTALRVIYQTKNNDIKNICMVVFLGLITFFIHGVFNGFIETDKMAMPVFVSIAAIVSLDLAYRKANKENDVTKSNL